MSYFVSDPRSNPDRREFIRRSTALALASAAAENALGYSGPRPGGADSPSASAEFFKGFKHERIKTSGASINLVHGGTGPPVLLLHGIPETYVLWRKVAPLLAQDFSLVISDLRGYGDSSKPPEGENHAGYSKRAMAQDQVEVMEHLGFRKFAVVGHDRGGRVAHRMALDHADRLTRLAILDIVPTYRLYQNITKEFATTFYHWFFLVQPAPFPETVVGNSAEYFLRTLLFRLGGEPPGEGVPGWVGEAAFSEYLRCFRDPATLHGICEDYRAAASIDLIHDAADQNRKIECPLLVLWAEKGPFHRMYKVLDTWRECASDVTGKALPAGHFLPEQTPQPLVEELKPFLSA